MFSTQLTESSTAVFADEIITPNAPDKAIADEAIK